LFVRAPGDFLYFLLVIGFTVASLFMALEMRQYAGLERAYKRYGLALVGVLLMWAFMVSGALYASFTQQSALAIVPPIERVVNVVVVCLLGWAFLTADHERWGRTSNLVVLLFIALAFVGYILTGAEWVSLANDATVDFNLRYGASWSAVLVVLATLGTLLSIGLLRYVLDAPLKLVFFLIILFGALYQLVQGSFIGSYAGITRVSLVLSFGLVPVMIYRLLAHQMTALAQKVQEASQAVVRPESLPRPIPPKQTAPAEIQSVLLMRTLGLVLDNATAENIPEQIVKATLDVLRVDIGILLKIQDANYADIVYAYDKVMRRSPGGIALNLNQQPTLVNVIERGLPRTLYVDRNKEELEDLFTRLDIDRIGVVYFQPLMRSQTLQGILAVGLPYSERELDENTLELLKSVGILASNLLYLSDEARESRILAEDRAIQAMVEGVALSQMPDDAVFNARQEMQARLQLAREQISHLGKQVMQLKLQLDDERTRLVSLVGDTQGGLSVSQTFMAIHDEQQRLRDDRDRLTKRLQEAETALNSVTASSNDAVIKQLVETLRKEQETLQQERDRLQQQLDEMKQQPLGASIEEMSGLVQKMQAEQTLLEQERRQLNDQLSGMQGQLKALGIEEGAGGLAQLAKLYEERATLEERLDNSLKEKELLLSERAKLDGVIHNEKERDAQISNLQLQIENLAVDRETALKQRDKLKREYETLQEKLNVVKEHRARLLAQVSGYELEKTERGEDSLTEKVAITQDAFMYQTQQPDLFVALVQELRTPLTSLKGYVDLLLGESAGILGEMQRKFLQRVSANSSRLEMMVEELVQVTQLDTGHYKLEPMPVSIVALIEDAITNASIQFREKGLSLSLDLDDDLPLLSADKDSLSQIVGQLLTNAYLVSPRQSSVTVIAQQRQLALGNDKPIEDVVFVSVEDRGGGIHPEDLPRVFSRKYKAENPLIQGLGDTGVGLSIAKTLIEAHGGYLWVEQRPNVGSIFSFALPLHPKTEEEK